MRVFVLLGCLLVGAGVRADALARFFPEPPAPIPALWWAIDTGLPLAIEPLQQWFDDTAPGQPAQSLRPLPVDGVGIGLLAGVPDAQGQWAVRELMAPWPLNLTRVWPNESRHRQVHITQAQSVGEQIALQLPLPGEVVRDVRAELWLPRMGPPQGPYAVDITLADSASQALVAIDNGDHITVSLSDLMQPWPLAQAAVATLTVRVSSDSPWSMAPIQAARPALWRLSWESPSAVLSGRAQWQRALQSLLMHNGARTQSVADLPAKLQAHVQGTAVPKETAVMFRPALLPEACGGRNGLLIDASSDTRAVAITQWLDATLQGPMQPYRVQARQHQGQFFGADVQYAAPRLGRALWPGDHGFMRCQAPADCDDISAYQPTLQQRARSASHAGVTLTDTALGPNDQLSVREATEPSINAVAIGQPLLIDAGADPTSATGRAQFLAWLAADATLWLRDGDDGELLWRWQPSSWQAYRDALRDKSASQPQSVSADALQLWRGASGERILYALQAGRLIALDLRQPERPIVLALTLDDVVVDSLSILPSVSGSNAPPELLLGVHPVDTSSTHDMVHLLQINGRTGERRWQTSSPADAPQWPQPWSFITWQQRLQAYAVDHLGRIWRLRANQSDALFEPPTIIAETSDNSAAMAQITRPDLSIQRDANGRARVALTLAGQHVATDLVHVFAWLDEDRESPLLLASLPRWRSASAPPAHSIGWQRRFTDTSMIGLSPRWLAGQIVLTVEAASAPPAPCLAAQISTTLYELPWRKGASMAKVTELGSSAAAPAAPVVSATGQLHWLGQTQAIAGPTLKAYRRRLSKQAEP